MCKFSKIFAHTRSVILSYIELYFVLCFSTTTTASLMYVNNTTETPLVTGSLSSNREFSIYEMSFYWYKVVGAFFVWISAIPLSYIWKRDKEEKMNPKLYSPFVKRFLSQPFMEKEEVPLRTPHPSLIDDHAKILITEKENGNSIKS